MDAKLHGFFYLCNDAEVRTINDKQYFSFRFALRSGKEGDEPTWVNGMYRYNERLKPYLVKGVKVYIDGPLAIKISDKDGKTYVNITVWANDLELCGSKEKTDGTSSAAVMQSAPAVSEADELPF